MQEQALVGRCGIYCGACIVYRAEHDQGELLDYFTSRVNCTKEEVTCKGCSGLTESCWGNDCKIVQCLNQKGYQYCYECDNFKQHTCDKRASLQARYTPRGVDLDKNLIAIQAGRVEDWLTESKQAFTCPSCGKPITYFYPTCQHCHKELKPH